MNKIILLFLLLSIGYCKAQGAVTTQDAAYPLKTRISEEKILEIQKNGAAKTKLLGYLKPLCLQNDAVACFYLAKTYDKFVEGAGTKRDADTALPLYQKAADLKLAEANYFLAKAYEYGFMNIETNPAKTLDYLQKTILFGSKSLKAAAYQNLARIYYPKGDSDVLSDKDKDLSKTLRYLENALALEPDSWTLDFIGGIYEDAADFEKASHYYLKSENEQMNLTVALWLAEGKNLPKDLPKALQIIEKAIQALEKAGYNKDNLNEYMGGIHPVYLLNELYQCKKLISEKQLGRWKLDYNVCN